MFELYTEKKSAAGGNGGDGPMMMVKAMGENPVVVAVEEKSGSGSINRFD